MTRLSTTRRIVLLAVFAVLFQALLFGWHHHPLNLPSSGSPAQVNAAAGTPLSSAVTDDDCDICMALHNLHAAPGEFAAISAPPIIATVIFRAEPVPAGQAAVRGFQARAPPAA